MYRTPVNPAYIATLLTEDPNTVNKMSPCSLCKNQASGACGWDDKPICSKHAVYNRTAFGGQICTRCKGVATEVQKDPTNMQAMMALGQKYGDHPAIRKAIVSWLNIDEVDLNAANAAVKHMPANSPTQDVDDFGFNIDDELDNDLGTRSLIGPRTANFLKDYATNVIKGPWRGMEDLIKADPKAWYAYVAHFAGDRRYAKDYKPRLEKLKTDGLDATPTRAAASPPGSVSGGSDQQDHIATKDPAYDDKATQVRRAATTEPQRPSVSARQSENQSASDRDEWDDEVDAILASIDDEGDEQNQLQKWANQRGPASERPTRRNTGPEDRTRRNKNDDIINLLARNIDED